LKNSKRRKNLAYRRGLRLKSDKLRGAVADLAQALVRVDLRTGDVAQRSTPQAN
jgi:hypothetical protein